jgi:alpha-methylacyl-CoA racemase
MLGRGRRSIALDLKHPEAVEVALHLVERSDVLIEPWRPGVAERLGISPEMCLARNPRLIYARMTGWGQHGPYHSRPGHDINYLALSGALDPLGRAGTPPTPPANLLADFGGGGLLCATGILAALVERASSGQGQVIDAAMVDGAALLATWIVQGRSTLFRGPRGTNIIDTGAHFYEVYETSDKHYISVGALEPQFYEALLGKLGLDKEALPPHMDRATWPDMKVRFADLFRSRTRQEWCDLLEDDEICFAPVLSPEEAAQHAHNRARGTYVDFDGAMAPAPAPRFSRTPAAFRGPAPYPGEHTGEVLEEAGYSLSEIATLQTIRAVE